MQQRLAHISVPQRHTSDTEGPRQKNHLQQRFVPSKAPYLIEFQSVKILINHTCRQKEHQLNQGMIDHMQQCPSDCYRIFVSQQPAHADAYQNKSDL